MGDEKPLLATLFELMDEGLEAGQSYTEAAMPAVEWLKREGLEHRFVAERGAVCIGYLCRRFNHNMKSGGAAEPGGDRLDADSLREGVGIYERWQYLGDSNVRTGDMTHEHCLAAVKYYREQVGHYGRLAEFWRKVGGRVKGEKRVRECWEEGTFAALLRKAEEAEGE